MDQVIIAPWDDRIGNSNQFKKIGYKINEKGCHEVVTHTSSRGYHAIRIDRKLVKIHRFAYEKVKGEIPEGKVLRHKCDNPHCCNVEHLELGTQKENVLDSIERKRKPNGEQIHSSKLTEEDVLFIRTEGMKISNKELAEKFNIDRSCISRIKNNKKWKHL